MHRSCAQDATKSCHYPKLSLQICLAKKSWKWCRKLWKNFNGKLWKTLRHLDRIYHFRKLSWAILQISLSKVQRTMNRLNVGHRTTQHQNENESKAINVSSRMFLTMCLKLLLRSADERSDNIVDGGFSSSQKLCYSCDNPIIKQVTHGKWKVA